MKRFILAFAAAIALFAACNPADKDYKPTVSFETAVPVVSDGVATLKITTSGFTTADPVTIPVAFGGDAVKGTDYEVSAEAFVIDGNASVTSITVTPLVYGSGKTISATLAQGDTYDFGKYPTSQWTLADRLGVLSFTTNKYMMTATASVQIGVYDNEGNGKKLETATEIEVEVDETKSTAVLGTHFQFKDDKASATIDSGESLGTVDLEFISLEEGKDKIVLKIKDDNRFGQGQYIETEITVVGPTWDKFDGKWVMNKVISDLAYLESINGEGWMTFNGLPEFNEADAITFDLATGKCIPAFQSTLKNYFIGESNIVDGGEYELRITLTLPPEIANLQLFELDNINRYFSETEASEDKTALIGVRIITDEETQAELLDLYIIDHTSKSFMPEMFEFYDPNRPVAYAIGSFLNYTFKRAE